MEKAERIRQMEMALREALAAVRPDVHLDWKRMFGGAGFFVESRVFAAWYGGSLALKLPPEAAQELLQIEGAVPAQTPQYIEVPESFLRDPTRLHPWVARSVEHVLRQPIRRPRRR
jgi:TfoX/Sxy family transcriptional regulator of competence genes